MPLLLKILPCWTTNYLCTELSVYCHNSTGEYQVGGTSIFTQSDQPTSTIATHRRVSNDVIYEVFNYNVFSKEPPSSVLGF